MIEYKMQPFHEIAEHVANNHSIHFDEMVEQKDADKPSVDWSYYIQLSKLGQCKAVVAYDGKNIVGYSCYSIANNPFHVDLVQASNDAIYVNKEYRGKITRSLIKKAEQFLKESGVKSVNYLISNPSFGALFERQGYKPSHRLWSISL